jgi:hypothetical protein
VFVHVAPKQHPNPPVNVTDVMPACPEETLIERAGPRPISMLKVLVIVFMADAFPAFVKVSPPPTPANAPNTKESLSCFGLSAVC